MIMTEYITDFMGFIKDSVLRFVLLLVLICDTCSRLDWTMPKVVLLFNRVVD